MATESAVIPTKTKPVIVPIDQSPSIWEVVPRVACEFLIEIADPFGKTVARAVVCSPALALFKVTPDCFQDVAEAVPEPMTADTVNTGGAL